MYRRLTGERGGGGMEFSRFKFRGFGSGRGDLLSIWPYT